MGLGSDASSFRQHSQTVPHQLSNIYDVWFRTSIRVLFNRVVDDILSATIGFISLTVSRLLSGDTGWWKLVSPLLFVLLIDRL